MKKQNISVLGIGYVGLCTAVGFASKGYNVIASTHNAEKAAKINNGIPPFHEPNLQKLLKETVQNGRLKCLVNQTEKVWLGLRVMYEPRILTPRFRIRRHDAHGPHSHR